MSFDEDIGLPDALAKILAFGQSDAELAFDRLRKFVSADAGLLLDRVEPVYARTTAVKHALALVTIKKPWH